nr:nucleotidyltransferase family protein [Clostridia bacterium]
MPKVLGITAEYDPFHNGHKYQLEEAVRRTGTDVRIAVISGNFTQRGEPALLDKWTRAEMAVMEGFDLVVEMPLLFALNNSGEFARAGVGILEDLGADYISFGSECGDLAALQEAAFRRDLMTEEDDARIRDLVREGYSYPRALQTVLREAEPLGPNDNLACEYLRNMKTARPVVIKREGAGYSDTDSEE